MHENNLFPDFSLRSLKNNFFTYFSYTLGHKVHRVYKYIEWIESLKQLIEKQLICRKNPRSVLYNMKRCTLHYGALYNR